MRWISILFMAAIATVLVQCDTNPYKQGKVLYEQNCQNCHQDDGHAVRGLIPPLAKSEYLSDPANVACIIRNGLKGEITVNGETYNHEMPPNLILTPTQISNIINYINNSWGNKHPFVSYNKVAESLRACGDEF